jgi:2-oxoglutarate ferredoxin oxidoreductase subunit alpha
MEILSREYPKVGGRMIQTEDEISALGMVIGASYAGQKAFTATSGPGVSLMVEMIGLSSIAEIPAVILNVMRGGPSTGIPTKTEQSDLQQALFATHGDAPKVVVAPYSVRSCFEMTMKAFYLAEKYQMPAIILADQFIGQRKVAIDADEIQKNKWHGKIYERPQPDEKVLAEGYKRYKLGTNPVVPMTWPGIKKGMYLAAGIEHDEKGSPSSVPEMHEKMNDKRYKKMEMILEEFKDELVEHIGPEDATCGIICWGSTRGVVMEVIENLNQNGYKIKVLVPKVLSPVPEAQLKSFISSLKKTLVIEMSYSKQFYYYLKSFVGLPEDAKLYKRSGGAPFTVEEIRNVIKEAF